MKNRNALRATMATSLALAAVAACTGQVLEAEPGPFASGAPGPGTVVSGDLPCEIAALLTESCITCHGVPPVAGVPMSLASHADLVAPSKSDPSKTAAEVSLARMLNAEDPMPPSGQLPPDRIAAFQAWVAAGTPGGECGSSGDGGLTMPLVCTSDQHWNQGNDGSQLMHPGMPCIGCHQTLGKGPESLLIAGTVFPTVREPNDCAGFQGAEVVVQDAAGRTLTLSTNTAGNFLYEDDAEKLSFPIRASVRFQGKERGMKDPVQSGDCNSCHTQDGANGAPGRIYVP